MATITTINATDLVSASRAVINTNFSNLNSAKVDGATALTTAGRLVEVASSGVATQTSFASSVVVLTSGSYADPAWVTSLATTKLTGTLQATQFPALTGDVTTSAGAVATTLANTAVTPASYGSATQVATFTVDSKGRLTAAASTSIAIAASQVTSGTLDNARTTAASTNTASAIVARDASGNFAAGTITATFSGNLTGNVTGNASGTAATITGALALANTPLTTRGDLLVATTATPILGRLAKGTQYQVLTGGATDPTWGAVDLSQATAITGTLPLGNGGTGATTLAGAGIVAGAASITTANALLIGASAGVLGQSDVSLASGIFSRAGTLGLSATGANIVTLATNGTTRLSISSAGTSTFSGALLSPTEFRITAAPSSQAFTVFNGSTQRWAMGTAGAESGANAGSYLTFYSYDDAGAFLSNPLSFMRTGNVLVGTTTDDGSSKLQVAGVIRQTNNTGILGARTDSGSAYMAIVDSSNRVGIGYNSVGIDLFSGTTAKFSITAGTATLYDPTAVTGSSTLVVRAGAGQSTTALQSWRIDNGTEFAKIWVNGANDYRLSLVAGSASILFGYIGGEGWVSTGGASTDIVLGTVGAERIRIQAADPGVKFATTTKIGFFGVTPVARAAALTAADATAINTGDAGSDTAISNMRTRIGELETKLQAYGLLN